jgi:F-type H+-transporting ATPase subunit delta
VIPGALARRYARALIGLAKDPAARDRFAKDMDAVATLVQQPDTNDRPLLYTLAAEHFPPSERRAVLETLCRRLGTDPTVVKFLAYVLKRKRMDGVVQIARAYEKLADDAAARVRAQITSARPLGTEATAKLKQALERATGKQVVLETAVDPELIGGVATKVGSYVLDGSIRASLDNLRSSLAAG